jgi:acetylornithine/succinyldiaminopimelate/putrescine aminotransferase
MASNRKLFLEHLAQTSDFPMAVEIERAEGCYMFGPGGKKYLDLIAGISVSNLGHGHSAIKKAINDQVETNMHLMVYGEFVQAPQVQLAAALHKATHSSLTHTYFTNSGSEAIEGAMKLAKRFTGRPEIACMYNAYHGSTHGALSMIGGPSMQQGFHPLLPGIKRLHFNHFDDLHLITSSTAAIFVEPVQGEAGIRPANPFWLEALRKKCDETGTLLVFDEIQTGYGRTGSLFAFQEYGIVPDVLVLAKGMGGGMPLGAFMARAEIMDCLRRDPILGHITTFGGHPVSCAASLAALTVLQHSDLIAQIPAKEELFRSLLVHEKIPEVRGKGLMLALELGSFEYVQEVIHRCIEKGLITDWFLFCDSSLRIAPPLIISEAEIKEACTILLEAL